jgi:uridine kinase
VIGIAGGSASGKTTVAHRIIDSMGQAWVCQISQDSFYKPLGPEDLEKAHNNEYDFDHPNALDLGLLVETLKRLKRGERVDIPVCVAPLPSLASHTSALNNRPVVPRCTIVSAARQREVRSYFSYN